jgi:dihydropteroate synthase
VTRERTRIMAVIATDGEPLSASIDRGLRLVEDGADVISVRHLGDSGSEAERRTLAAVGELSRSGAEVGVETGDAGVALLAAERGATIVHDVSGAADTFMPAVVSEAGLTLIAGCWSAWNVGEPIERAIRQRVEHLRDAGIPEANLVIDATSGESIEPAESWRPMLELTLTEAHPAPIMIAASRLAFLRALLPEGATTDEGDAAAVAVSVLAANSGVWAVSVDNVARTCAALRASRRSGASRLASVAEAG